MNGILKAFVQELESTWHHANKGRLIADADYVRAWTIATEAFENARIGLLVPHQNEKANYERRLFESTESEKKLQTQLTKAQQENSDMRLQAQNEKTDYELRLSESAEREKKLRLDLAKSKQEKADLRSQIPVFHQNEKTDYERKLSDAAEREKKLRTELVKAQQENSDMRSQMLKMQTVEPHSWQAEFVEREKKLRNLLTKAQQENSQMRKTQPHSVE